MDSRYRACHHPAQDFKECSGRTTRFFLCGGISQGTGIERPCRMSSESEVAREGGYSRFFWLHQLDAGVSKSISLVSVSAFGTESVDESLLLSGSASSGSAYISAISNLVMASFDESMGGWCEERQISYTRYCDDMTFSGEFDPGMVIRKVSAYLEQMGMVLNRKKTRVYTRGSRQEVTGLTVNERVQVPRFYRKKLRQEWYYCKKYGVKEHIKALSLEAEPAAYLAGLMGKVQYVLQIDPENREFLQYRKEIQEEITKNYEN